MSPEDHLEYLKFLEEGCGEGRMAIPKREGAFYYGNYMDWDEYADRYRKSCISEGWINES